MGDMKIRFTKLDERAVTPTYGSAQAAGFDLYLLPDGDVMVSAGETVMLRTGIALEIPDGYAGLVFARSGLASKRGLAPANKVGVIDSDYRGEIMVAMHNHSDEDRILKAGERMAQMCVVPCIRAELEECGSLTGTERGAGGFGSTGRQ